MRLPNLLSVALLPVILCAEDRQTIYVDKMAGLEPFVEAALVAAERHLQPSSERPSSKIVKGDAPFRRSSPTARRHPYPRPQSPA